MRKLFGRDNDYIGYACAFNSQGDVELIMKATGEPGWHFIDLYPGIYKCADIDQHHARFQDAPFRPARRAGSSRIEPVNRDVRRGWPWHNASMRQCMPCQNQQNES
jgi:hypothetical protein